MIGAMSRLLFILGITFGSMAAGYLVQRIVRGRYSSVQDAISSISRRLKILAVFILEPIAIISTFWGIDIPDARLLALPVLGPTVVLIGMAAAVAAVRILKSPPYRAGSVFTCGTFSNMLTIGGLISFTFLGEPGYALVQLLSLATGPTYIILAYPISSNIGHGRKPVFKVSLASIKENPLLLVPIVATALGIGMHSAGVARPEVFVQVVAVVIPCVAAVLGISIGLSLRFTGFRSYLREIGAVLIIRFLVVPAVIIPAALLLRFGDIADGLLLKVTIIISVMPVAFNALVPPAIYGFDLDLANSAWMVSTGFLAIIVPLLYVVLRVLL